MNRLKELRKKNNITLQKLADYLHIANSAVSQYENGHREPSFEIVSKLADYFNVSIDYLLGRENIESVQFNRNVVKIPIYGQIPAGIPIEMIEDSFVEDYEELDASSVRGGQYFGLKVKGNSMYPEFKNGDTIIFKQQDNCESGQFCAVSINHTECTFKKVLKKESGITLMPLNPDYEPLFFTNDEIKNLPITILGVVKEVRRTY